MTHFSRTARLKLGPRKKPYRFVTIALESRLATAGTRVPGWVLRAGNGRGGYWTDAIGLADDHEPADGLAVLTFWEAQDKARALVRGARPSQIARLDVADLQDDRDDARLTMPSSLKGRGRKRVERRPVPIPVSLAAKLQQAAGGKSPGAPLLTKADSTRWQAANHIKPFARAAAQAGLAHFTAYALRHSSIIRALLAGVPTRVAESDRTPDSRTAVAIDRAQKLLFLAVATNISPIFCSRSWPIWGPKTACFWTEEPRPPWDRHAVAGLAGARGKRFIRALPAGPRRAFGTACSSIWPRMPTTNTR
jgi:hypothetical protein